MSVTPRGLFSMPVRVLRAMLANCASFQKLTQLGTATAALAKAYPFGVIGQPARPFAIVSLEDWSPEAVAGGSRLDYADMGKLGVMVELATKLETQVTMQNSSSVFRASSLVGLKDDHFKGLKLKVLSGIAAGQVTDISAFNGTLGELTLSPALGSVPAVADQIRIFPNDDADAYTWFMNTMGDIISELLALSGQGLDLTTIDSSLPAGTGCVALRQPRQEIFSRAAPELEATDYLIVVWEFEYGR